MLNKEAMLNGAKTGDGAVIMTVGGGEFGNFVYYGYYPGNSLGSLDKVPYWGDKSHYLTYLVYTKYRRDDDWMEAALAGGGSSYKGNDIKVKATFKTLERALDITFVAPYLSAHFDNSVSLVDSVGEKIPITFAPPQTDICRGSRHLFNGGGVNARERSTIARAGEEGADAEHPKWMAVQLCLYNVQDGVPADPNGRLFRLHVPRPKSAYFAFTGGGRNLRAESAQRRPTGEKCPNKACGNSIRHRRGILHRRPHQGRGDPLVTSLYTGGANA